MRILPFGLIAIAILMIVGNKKIQKPMPAPIVENIHPTSKAFHKRIPAAKVMSQSEPAYELQDAIEPQRVGDNEMFAEMNLDTADKETVIAECQYGNWQACQVLSHLCYERNFDVCFELGKKFSELDQKKAIPYYKAACEQTKHAESCLYLAMAISETKAEAPLEKILSYLHTSCMEGDISMACLEMAEIHPDPAERKFFQAQAEKLTRN